MASLTIRNLDDELMRRLRVRAAEHGRSVQEEARAILSEALEPANQAKSAKSEPEENVVQGIRRIVERVGGFDIEIHRGRRKGGPAHL